MPIPNAIPPEAPGDPSVVESVVDFLLSSLDGAQLDGVLRRIAPHQRPPGARIPCLGARAIKLVPLAEVEYVRSSLAGVHAVTAAGEFYTERTLAALEAATGLVRCHKQFLVNPERVDEVDLAGESVGTLRTRSGFTVPVSRRYRQRLRAALQI